MLLISLIPHRDIVDDARKESTLGYTEEEPGRQIPTVILHDSKQSCDDAPNESQGRQPEPRGGSFQDDVARNLKQHITNGV